MSIINKREIGKKYEKLAELYLIENGYEIKETNYYTPYGEIDIIAENSGIIVFVEIKYRSNKKFGDALEAVDIKKQIRISKSAMYYTIKKGYGSNKSYRFDVIAIYKDNTIRHVENAFDYHGNT